MPIYTGKCDTCGEEQDFYRCVAEYDQLPECCGATVKRVIHASYLQASFNTYKSPVDGSIIDDKSKHREHKRKHGLIEVGNEKLDQPATKKQDVGGLKEEIVRNLS